eukprot:5428294-Prymnesium_polylepis.7
MKPARSVRTKHFVRGNLPSTYTSARAHWTTGSTALGASGGAGEAVTAMRNLKSVAATRGVRRGASRRSKTASRLLSCPNLCAWRCSADVQCRSANPGQGSRL